MVEGHLMSLAEFLLLMNENQSALVIATIHTLNKSAAFQNGMIVPLDLEHPPVLLYGNCGIPFLLSILLCLTISSIIHKALRT
jgi:hypothetical protein